MSEFGSHPGKLAPIARAVISAAGVAIYIALAAWSYSAALADDMIFAAILIFLAFLVGFAALWFSEQFGAFSSRDKLRLNLFAAVVIAAVSIAVLYFGNRDRPKEQHAADPADVVITPLEAEKLKDGTYYLPIEIANDGQEAVNGYAAIFKQEAHSTRLSNSETDSMMIDLENKMHDQHFTTQSIENMGNLISGTKAKVLRETLVKFTEVQLNQVKSGNLFPYYGVIFIYADDTARKRNELYYAERCMYFDGNISNYIDCAGHNFPKKVWN